LAPAGNAEQVEDSTATITRLTNTILTLNHDIERLHETYGRKINDRERNVYHLWDEQRNWIANLEKVNAWLEEQRRNWQSEAERRGGMIRELQLWIAELEKGKAWLEEQRRNWQSEAERRGDMIKELQR
jgi:chromosome segregation ATPase